MKWYVFIALLLELITYGSFIWVAMFYFKKTSDTRQKEYRIVKYVGLVSILLLIMAGYRSHEDWASSTAILAMVLFSSSLGLLWSAVITHIKKPLYFAFTDQPPDRLSVIGPYAIVRHPVYSSYLIGWLAGVCISGSIVYILIPIIMGMIYLQAIHLEESQYRSSNWSKDYEHYQSKVKKLIPFIY
jgi:protein-S-isoprenylcysteine O-methyltransferase Ste14